MSHADLARERIRRWKADPRIFVREVFGVTPDPWQDKVLEAFPYQPRIALLACKGPGKTALLAWLVWNFLVTRPHPRIAATAITGDNLKDNLWTELAKWMKRSSMIEQLFTWRQERITLNEHPETWWCSARTWPRSASPDQQANTLAGLHADHLLFVLDESGGIPDAVMSAAEGGLANVVDPSRQEAHIVQAGNPTHLEGPLYRAAIRDRAMWFIVEITADPDDPLRTPRVSKEWAREQISMYGADNPWVLINVYGRFPPSSINALLGPEDVAGAVARAPRLENYQHSPKTIGVDVARQGDDRSVIFRRQGIISWKPLVFRNLDSQQLAGRVAREWDDWDADGVLVDGTGGWGAGVVDALRGMHRSPVEVQFAGKPTDARYYNKRAEMWFETAEWVKRSGCLPDDPDLVGELCSPTYSFKGDRMIIEDKELIKARLGRSPDKAEALILTFAEPVLSRQAVALQRAIQRPRQYDPHQRL